MQSILKIYILIKVPYNCILNLYFAIHYLNNPIVDKFMCIFLKPTTFLKAITNKKFSFCSQNFFL